MRYLHAMVFALVCAAAGCCLVPPEQSETVTVQHPPAAPLTGNPSTTVFIDVAQIERPAGDVFLNQDLWQLGNEQGVVDVQPVLEENGLRVCQIGGLIPARLQALLSSQRTCPNPRRLHAEFDQPTPVLIGGSERKLSFQFHHPAEGRTLDLSRAQCQFLVVAREDEDRRIRLSFTPRIRHGQARVERHVTEDPGGQLRWEMAAREVAEEFSPLTWELVVAPDEYVVVGARLEKPGTLGPAFFLSGTEEHPVQRLLVLRAKLSSADVTPGEPSKQPPLAQQASMAAR